MFENAVIYIKPMHTLCDIQTIYSWLSNKDKRHGVEVGKLFYILEILSIILQPALSSDIIYLMFSYCLYDITLKYELKEIYKTYVIFVSQR